MSNRDRGTSCLFRAPSLFRVSLIIVLRLKVSNLINHARKGGIPIETQSFIKDFYSILALVLVLYRQDDRDRGNIRDGQRLASASS